MTQQLVSGGSSYTTTGPHVVYTVPIATTAVLTDLRISNLSNATVGYSLVLGGRAYCAALQIPSGAVDPWVQGNSIVLAAGETISLSLSVGGQEVSINFSAALRS